MKMYMVVMNEAISGRDDVGEYFAATVTHPQRIYFSADAAQAAVRIATLQEARDGLKDYGWDFFSRNVDMYDAGQWSELIEHGAAIGVCTKDGESTSVTKGHIAGISDDDMQKLIDLSIEEWFSVEFVEVAEHGQDLGIVAADERTQVCRALAEHFRPLSPDIADDFETATTKYVHSSEREKQNKETTS